jgi:hypothetical protein
MHSTPCNEISQVPTMANARGRSGFSHLAGVAVLGAAILSSGCRPGDPSSGTDKRACAEAIQSAISKSRSRDEAEGLLRADPQARKVCAGLEMNGVAVIP